MWIHRVGPFVVVVVVAVLLRTVLVPVLEQAFGSPNSPSPQEIKQQSLTSIQSRADAASDPEQALWIL